jgi:cell division protein FtsW
MTAATASTPFPARLKVALRFDPVLLSIVLLLMFGGFVVLASASISISDNLVDEPFYYVERQLLAAIIGGIAAGVCLYVPMQFWQSIGPLMLLAGLALLFLVLLPGVGYEVNGSRRWIRFGLLNLQVSEPARLCLIVYLAATRNCVRPSSASSNRCWYSASRARHYWPSPTSAPRSCCSRRR